MSVEMLRILPFLLFFFFFILSCNELFPCLNTAYAKSEALDRPFFGDNSRNITALSDGIVTLKCTVKNKGNRTVSWIRRRDLAILTSNTFVYTTDTRFSVVHIPDSNNWDLRVKPVSEKDSGVYECQINTEPKINFPMHLDVIKDSDAMTEGGYKIVNRFDGKVPRAKIVGPSELQVLKGSTISLTCMVNLQASLILWYHNSTIINSDFTRGGINLENEKTESGTTSRLLLTRANFKDSGNYTCVPASQSTDTSSLLPTYTALPDSVAVQIVNR